MNKNFLWVDIVREIQKTKGRFLTLMLLSALGVACFVGFSIAPTLMNLWADNLYESQKFMDFTLLSKVGFTQEDVEKLHFLEGIETAQGSYQSETTVLGQVLQIHSYQSSGLVNQLILEEGRFPENSHECMVEPSFLQETGVNIGDKIQIDANSGFLLDEFTIVGIAKSPLFVSPYRGVSSLGDGQVDSLLFLKESVFTGDFTHLYLTLCKETLDNSEDLQLLLESIAEMGEISWNEASPPYIESLETEIESISTKLYWETYNEKEKLAESRLLLAHALEDVTVAWADFQANIDKFTQEEEILERERIALLEEIYTDSLLAFQVSEEKAEQTLTAINKSLSQAQRDLALLKNGGWETSSRSENHGYQSYQQDADSIYRLSLVFPVIFFAVTALISWGATSHMIAQKRVEIGTLRAFGYGKLEICLKYMLYPLFSNLLGGILGLFLGLYLLPSILYYLWSQTYLIGAFQVSIDVKISFFAVGIALMVGGISGMCSCFSILTKESAEILRPKAPTAGGEILLERSYLLWSGLKFHQKVTMRSLFRDPKRVFLSIFSIGSVTGVMVSAIGLSDANAEANHRQYEELYRHSTQVVLRENVTEEERMEVQGQLSEFGLSNHYTSFSAKSVTVGNEMADLWQSSEIYTVESPEALEQVFYLRKSKWQPYNMPINGVILPIKVAENLDLDLGDTVTMVGDFGTVTGIVSALSEQYVNQYIFMTNSYYTSITGKEPEINEFWVNYSEMKVDSPENRTLLDEKLVGLDGTAEVSHRADQRDFYTDSIKVYDYTIIAIFFLVCLLAFVVLSYLNQSNLSNRQGELATLKILGFTDYELSAYIYKENIILTFYGLVLGMIIGQNFHYWVIETVEIPTIMLYRGLHIYRFLSAAALSALFAILVNIQMYWQLKNLDMTEDFRGRN